MRDWKGVGRSFTNAVIQSLCVQMDCVSINLLLIVVPSLLCVCCRRGIYRVESWHKFKSTGYIFKAYAIKYEYQTLKAVLSVS